MQRTNIFLIIIIAVLIVALSFVGYLYYQSSNTNNYNLNNTFSKEGISFNYPNNFKENPNISFDVSGNPKLKFLTYLTDNKTSISVMMMPLELSDGSIQKIKDSSKKGIKESSDFQVLGDKKLNLTGIPEAYEVIYTMTNPEKNVLNKGYYLFIGQTGQIFYGIQVQGPIENFNNTKSLYDKLVPTIKIE